MILCTTRPRVESPTQSANPEARGNILEGRRGKPSLVNWTTNLGRSPPPQFFQLTLENLSNYRFFLNFAQRGQRPLASLLMSTLFIKHEIYIQLSKKFNHVHKYTSSQLFCWAIWQNWCPPVRVISPTKYIDFTIPIISQHRCEVICNSCSLGLTEQRAKRTHWVIISPPVDLSVLIIIELFNESYWLVIASFSGLSCHSVIFMFC